MSVVNHACRGEPPILTWKLIFRRVQHGLRIPEMRFELDEADPAAQHGAHCVEHPQPLMRRRCAIMRSLSTVLALNLTDNGREKMRWNWMESRQVWQLTGTQE